MRILQKTENFFLTVLGLAELEFIFLCPHNAVLCIGSCKGADNTPAFWLLLRNAGTASALSPQYSAPHQQDGLGQDPGRGHKQASWPKLTRGTFQTISSDIKAKGERRNGGHLLFQCLSSRAAPTCAEALLPGKPEHCLPVGS